MSTHRPRRPPVKEYFTVGVLVRSGKAGGEPRRLLVHGPLSRYTRSGQEPMPTSCSLPER
jgi:hypothetical protein